MYSVFCNWNFVLKMFSTIKSNVLWTKEIIHIWPFKYRCLYPWYIIKNNSSYIELKFTTFLRTSFKNLLDSSEESSSYCLLSHHLTGASWLFDYYAGPSGKKRWEGRTTRLQLTSLSWTAILHGIAIPFIYVMNCNCLLSASRER